MKTLPCLVGAIVQLSEPVQRGWVHCAPHLSGWARRVRGLKKNKSISLAYFQCSMSKCYWMHLCPKCQEIGISQKKIKTSCLVFFMSVLWVISVCPVKENHSGQQKIKASCSHHFKQNTCTMRRFKFESHRFVLVVRLEYFPSTSSPSCTAPPPQVRRGTSVARVKLQLSWLWFCASVAT